MYKPVAKPARPLVMQMQIVPYAVCKHRKICICMTKIRADFATGINMNNFMYISYFLVSLYGKPPS